MKTAVIDRRYSSKAEAKALLLGLGGGCVANELIKKNFEVDAVELDKRVGFAAAKFFNLNTKTKVYIDDARRFIKNTNKKYIFFISAFPLFNLLNILYNILQNTVLSV